jgi:hypothetical protein
MTSSARAIGLALSEDDRRPRPEFRHPDGKCSSGDGSQRQASSQGFGAAQVIRDRTATAVGLRVVPVT